MTTTSADYTVAILVAICICLSVGYITHTPARARVETGFILSSNCFTTHANNYCKTKAYEGQRSTEPYILAFFDELNANVIVKERSGQYQNCFDNI